MGAARRVAKNTAALVSAEVVSKALMFVFVVYLARMLGDVEFGKYSFAFAFTGIFSILTAMGLDPLFVREVAGDKRLAARYLGGFLIIRVIASLVTLILIFVSINLMHYPHDTKNVVYLIGVYAVLNSIATLFKSLFQAFERMEYNAFIRVFDRVLLVIICLILLFKGFGLFEVALAFLLVGAVVLITSYAVSASRFVKPELKFDPVFIKSSVKAALPFMFTSVFGVIYFSIDTVMLSVMKGDAVVGWYNAPYQIIAALLFIPGMFMAAVYPLMSQYYKTSRETLVVVYEKSLKYLTLAAVPLAVGTTVLADKFIILLYGPSYTNSIEILRLLIWCGALIFLNYMFSGLLAVIYQEKIRLWVSGFCALLNVILNLLLIPHFSMTGAAVATVITQLTLLALGYHYVSKHFHKTSLAAHAIKPLASGLLMGAVTYYLRPCNLYIAVAASALFYLASLYALKVFSSEDRILLSNVFNG